MNKRQNQNKVPNVKINGLDFRAAERSLRRIIRKLGNGTLDYTLQVSVDSTKPGLVSYAAMITAPAPGIQPITWIRNTGEELLHSLKLSEKTLDKDEVEKAYHRFQIAACKRTIEEHERKIQEIENSPKEEVPNGQKEPIIS